MNNTPSARRTLGNALVSTPSARRKLGNISVNTPGTNGSLKSTGSTVGSFRKPHTPPPLHQQHHRKDEAFVKPLNFAKPASEEAAAVSCAPLKPAVLPTLYECEIEHCNPPTWQELRQDFDPPMHYSTLEDVTFWAIYTDESEVEEEEDSSQKENLPFGHANRPLEQQQQVSSGLFARPDSKAKKALKKAGNFTRLITLDEICELV